MTRGPSRRKGSLLSGGKASSLWVSLNSSFWFLPALITAGGVLLYGLAQYADLLLRADPSGLPIVFSGDATAARAVLAAIAGSLITVIATVFSLTIVTFQLASSQYTPRLLRIFVADRGLQVVLGAFIATFVYSILVLRIIRTSGGETATFIPVISVTGAVVLALVCVTLLIYFIQHVATLIQSSTIVDRIHRNTMASVAELDDLKDLPEGGKAPEVEVSGDPVVVQARKSGYVQYVDVDSIARAVAASLTSGEKTAAVEIPSGPGFFVSAGLPVARFWPGHGVELSPQQEKRVHSALVFGNERSFHRDFAFGFRQLSDIALKGLSPAVNDPTTAMQAMDRIEAVFVALGSRAMPGGTRERQIGGVRLLVRMGYYDFDDAVGLALDQIRRAAFTSGQVAVLERLLEVVERALVANPGRERRQALWARAFAVARLAPGEVSDPRDAANLVLRAVEMGTRMPGLEVASDLGELVRLSGSLPGGARIREATGAVIGEQG